LLQVMMRTIKNLLQREPFYDAFIGSVDYFEWLVARPLLRLPVPPPFNVHAIMRSRSITDPLRGGRRPDCRRTEGLRGAV